MFAQPPQQQLPALDHLQRGNVTVHLLRRLGHALYQSPKLRVADGGEQHQVPAKQSGSRLNHLRRGGGLRKVGQPDDEAPLRVKAQKQVSRSRMIGFVQLAADQRESVKKGAEVRRAPSCRQARLRHAAVREQSHSVTGVERNVGERQGRRGRVVEFGEGNGPAVHPGQHQPAGVQDDQDGLATLGVIDLRDELGAASRRRPADVPRLIALSILPQALKFAAQAGLPLQTLFLLHLPGADQVKGVLVRLLQVRVDAEGLIEIGNGPALRQLHRALKSEEDGSGRDVAPLDRSDRISPARAQKARSVQLHLGWLGAQGTRDVVIQDGVAGRV